MRNILITLFMLLAALSVSAQREESSMRQQRQLLNSRATTTNDDDDSPYFTLIGEAEKAVASMRWDDAAEALKAAMREEPGNPTNILLMSNLGMIYFHAGCDSLALDVLNMAHSMAPASVTVLQNRARVLAVTGHEEEAFADYGRVIQLDSLLTEPLYIHGMMALERGDYTTAEGDLSRLQELAPDDVNTLVALSTLYRSTLRFAEALPYLDKLVETEPMADNYGARAVCRLFTDDLNGASEDIAQGLSLDPNNGQLYLYRSLLNRARYRFDDAKADAKTALSLGIPADRIPQM